MKHHIITSLAAVMLLLTATVTFASCGKQTLTVTSVDYPKITELTASEPDYDRIFNWPFLDNPYAMKECYLKLSDDNKLVIYDNEPFQKTHIYCGNSCYFLGVSLGHFEGWVKMYPYNHLLLQSDYHENIVGHPTEVEIKVVAEENCLGFIEIDVNNAYLITYDAYGYIRNDDGSRVQNRIYRLYLDSGKDWKWEIIGSTKNPCSAYFYDEDSNGIYFVDIDEVTYFDLETYEFTTITQTPHFHLDAASMVKLDNKIYLSWSMGIYEYNLDSGESLWYPIPHEKYGTKEEKDKYEKYVAQYKLLESYGVDNTCNPQENPDCPY